MCSVWLGRSIKVHTPKGLARQSCIHNAKVTRTGKTARSRQLHLPTMPKGSDHLLHDTNHKPRWMKQSETKLTCLVQSCSEGADIITQVADYQTVCEYFHMFHLSKSPLLELLFAVHTIVNCTDTCIQLTHMQNMWNKPTVLQSKRVPFLKSFKFHNLVPRPRPGWHKFTAFETVTS